MKMEKYDYYEAVLSDIWDWYEENKDHCPKWRDADEACEWLEEHLWTSDQVTGNGSGSYWFSTWKAEEALCHNLDLLCETLEAYGGDADPYKTALESPETADVYIRCHLLNQAIWDFVNGAEQDGTIKYEEEEEE